MYTAFTVIGDIYAKIFLVADERMSGKWGGRQARHAMPVMRSMSGRVWSAAPTPPPRNAEGGVLRERDVAETRHALRQRNALPVVRRNIDGVVIDVYGVDGFAVSIRHQMRVSDVHLNVHLRLVLSIGLLVPLAS